MRTLGQASGEERFHIERAYLDTTDGRLVRGGYVLECDELSQGEHLRLRPLCEERNVWSGDLAATPRSADDFPTPSLRRLMHDLLGPEPLRAVLRCRVRGTRWRLVDSIGKTTAWVQCERCETVPGEGAAAAPSTRPILRVQPLRGFESQTARTLETTLPQGELEPTREDPLHLLLGASPHAESRKKAKLKLRPEMTVRAALVAVLRAYFQDLVANEARVATDVEALHEFRVAARRARSVLQALRDRLDKERATRLLRELGWLSKVTGPQRDLDVLLEDVKNGAIGTDVAPPALGRLEQVLADHRVAERARLRLVLSGERYQALKTGWTEICQPHRHGTRDGAAYSVVSPVIARLYAKFIKQGKQAIETQEFERLHAWRKTGKKLRYLIESFQTLYAEKRIARAVRELKHLQDTLGIICDRTTQSRLLKEWSARLPAGTGDDDSAEIARLSERLIEQFNARDHGLRSSLAKFMEARNRKTYQRLFDHAR